MWNTKPRHSSITPEKNIFCTDAICKCEPPLWITRSGTYKEMPNKCLGMKIQPSICCRGFHTYAIGIVYANCSGNTPSLSKSFWIGQNDSKVLWNQPGELHADNLSACAITKHKYKWQEFQPGWFQWLSNFLCSLHKWCTWQPYFRHVKYNSFVVISLLSRVNLFGILTLSLHCNLTISELQLFIL